MTTMNQARQPHQPHSAEDFSAALLFLVAFCVLLLAGHSTLAADASASKAKPTNHWAFKPVVRPPVPISNFKSQVSNPIDAFIVAELRKHGLTPSPPADRRTLIRRLYFDLIGLPPKPEEVEAFINDRRKDAYEKLVDHLLNSPHYGERWARHWLDVVRFAETHGFEMNNPRPNAWPYRDYVIRAFNDDKPYDQFLIEQLAGDVLGVDEATGFLVGGPWDQVKSPDVVLTSNQRADELHDMVSTTGSAFLGLTVGCARCHDHKFDPIPQVEYYAIKACLAGVQHGERKLKALDAEARTQEAAEKRQRLAEVEAQLARFEPLAQTGPSIDTNRLRAPVHPRMNVERFAPVAAKRLRFTIQATSDAEPCIDELEVYTSGEGSTNVALASAGVKASASGTYPNSEIHRLEHLNDGKVGNSRSWISNEPGKGWVQLEFPETTTIERIVWGRDREEKFKDRLAVDYRIEVASAADDWRLVASSADRWPYAEAKKFTPRYLTNQLSAAEQAALEGLVAERKELEARVKTLTAAPMVYAGSFAEKPEETHRFHRGDPMQKREAVEPAALGVLPVKFDLGRSHGRETAADLKADDREVSHRFTSVATGLAEEQQRRLALALWIADPVNPLTARVMVNRIWQHHFGEGLVSTPSDFGANGAKPTHPELLDWLAAEFMEHGWSVKHIHRLIVTSATYRQRSEVKSLNRSMVKSGKRAGGATVQRFNASPGDIDADNRLLWRFPARRLEAEPLRDAILAVSGKLDLKMGGPGWSPFEPNENYVRVYTPRQEFGPAEWRRMVYATGVRQRPDGVFGAFDCPDGGQIAPKRTRSTTPLQALNLLNSGFIMQQARFFAERLEREAGKDVKDQARRAFVLALQREPDRAELAAATALAREQGLVLFCRALLNANEFVYVY
ncbi:MAG: DUF1553 domain-containing protein [Verrucomicrobia bacterium]|nr:DUF1553 domain-containing protein [Verrucomicrobiota bacterium]